MLMKPSPWLIHTPRPGSSLRLYCFAYAGGSAHVFAGWQAQLPPQIEVAAIQLPGRAARMAEAPPASIAQIVEQLAPVIASQDVPRFAFFGHSLGALVAFELARHMAARGMRQPEHLFASACNPPQHRGKSRMLHQLPDQAFLDALAEYDGTPPEVLQHRELMELMMPTLRADFRLAEGYAYAPGPLLAMPMTVLCGQQDQYVDVERAALWQSETLGACATEVFDGGHFFLTAERQAALAHVSRQLLPGQRAAA